jgi:hypothetical protein
MDSLPYPLKPLPGKRRLAFRIAECQVPRPPGAPRQGIPGLFTAQEEGKCAAPVWIRRVFHQRGLSEAYWCPTGSRRAESAGLGLPLPLRASTHNPSDPEQEGIIGS